MDSTLQKAISDGVIVSVPGPSNYKCSLCKKTLCGDAPAKQHLSGKEHLKNGASYILTNPSDKRQSLKKLVSPGLLAAAEKKVVQGLRCRICGLDFTGVAPLEQHVTGSDHAKKLQVLGLPKTPQIAALHDGNGPMECGLCKVQCTGKQSYDEHVKGEKHKKKALSLGMQIGATASVNSTLKALSLGMQIGATASVNSTPKALSLGMQIGATASVNSTPKKTANLPTLYDGNGPIACILCKITCTGKQSYIEHVKGEKHRKKAFAATSVDNTLERTPAHFIPQALGATSMQTTPANFLIQPSRATSFQTTAAYLPPEPLGATSMLRPSVPHEILTERPAIRPSVPHEILTDRPAMRPSVPHEILTDRPAMRPSVPHEILTDRPAMGISPETRKTYRVASFPRGFVYVFNYKFTGQVNERYGAEVDSMNLKETFTELGYEVFLREDFGAQQTKDELDNIRTDPRLNDVDALIFFFLSHGNSPHTFQGNDNKDVNLRSLRLKFAGSKCPQMKEKPKIFFTNYCRGERFQKKIEYDDSVEPPRDMVTIHSAIEGVKAIRSPTLGTYFVKCLCDVLRQHSGSKNLKDVYYELDRKTREMEGTQPMWEEYIFYEFFF